MNKSKVLRYYTENLEPRVVRGPFPHCCPFCLALIGLDAWSEHVQKCPFILHVGDLDPCFAIVFPLCPQMMDPNSREKSIRGISSPNRIDLAKSGFFHEKNKNHLDVDFVRCFFCSVSMGRWKYYDDPCDVHVERSPACEYAKFQYMNRVVKNVSKALEEVDPQFKKDKILLSGYFSRHWRFEKERLKTFEMGCWPLRGQVEPEDLARVGFVYLYEGDRVQCVFCQTTVENWKSDEIPMKRHFEANPSCPFVRGHWSIDNVPLNEALPDEDLGMVRRPMRKGLTSAIKRLQTFDKWPHLAEPSRSDLVAAGFYYTGTADVVACHWCDVRLWDFQKGQKDPFKIHVEKSPRCMFIEMERMKKYLQENKSDGEEKKTQMSDES